MKIPRGKIKQFRQHLNSQDAGDLKHRHFNYQQRTRLYGDYLYFQDRDRFMAELKDWLQQTL